MLNFPIVFNGSPNQVMAESMIPPHDRFLRQALKEAERAFEAGEVPVGAVVVHEGKVIGRGHNRREALADPTAHAELLAITAAANSLGDWRLEGCTLYVTKEPCPMCAGAVVNSRLERLVFTYKADSASF